MVVYMICKAVCKTTGESCKLEASINGYCLRHYTLLRCKKRDDRE